MERTSLHNDSLLYASLIAILLLISYWFTTRCFKIISGIEGMGLGTWGDRVTLARPVPFHKPGGEASCALGVGEGDWGPSSLPLWDTSISSVTLFVPPGPGPDPLCARAACGSHGQAAAVPRAALGASGSAVLPASRCHCHCPSLWDGDADGLPGASCSVGGAQC